MWLLAIEIIAAIVAAARGWGFWPFALIGTTFVLGLILGPTATYDTIALLSVLDWIITVVVVGMAIVGRKSTNQTRSVTEDSRVKCPYCAELIMPEAKVCRFCGYQFTHGQPTSQDIAVQSGERTTVLTPPIARSAQSNDTSDSLSIGVRTCPKCGLAMIIRTADQGEHQGELFYICPNYSKCRQVFPVDDQATNPTASVIKPKQSGKVSASPTTTVPSCPKCGIAMTIRTANQGEHKGKRFYVCPNYSKCKQVIPID